MLAVPSGLVSQQTVDVRGDELVELAGVELVALRQQPDRKGEEILVQRVEQLQGVDGLVGVLGLDVAGVGVDFAGVVDVVDRGAHHVAGIDAQGFGAPDAHLGEDTLVVDEHHEARERGELLAVEVVVLRLLGGRHYDDPF